MYYELYVDTLFLVNFVMNLYLLMLANNSAFRTATRLRMIAASAVGAFFYVAALAIPVLPVLIRFVIQTSVTVLIMIKIAFNPKSLTGYKKLLENILGYSFFLGGGLYVLRQYIENSTGIAFVMGCGGLFYMFVSYVISKRKGQTKEVFRVTLLSGQKEVKVRAILDTGNGLCEPVSGKPVSVVNKSVADALWEGSTPEYFRAIPYHSVGRAHGMMQGYVVKEMTIELDGIPRNVPDIYIAVSPEEVSVKNTYEMLINPRVLEQ